MNTYILALDITQEDGVCTGCDKGPHLHISPRPDVEAGILRDALAKVPLIEGTIGEAVRREVSQQLDARVPTIQNTMAPDEPPQATARCGCPGRQYGGHADGCPLAEAKPFA